MMDKAERYAYERTQNLYQMFDKFNPPKHPNLPLVEQALLTALYTGFRLYFLKHKDTIRPFDLEHLSWASGFPEYNEPHELFHGMGYYSIHDDRIEILSIGKLFIGILPSELGHLTALRKLYIQKHDIGHITWASAYPYLETLQFNDCDLSQIPPFIANSHHLQFLFLRDNQIISLPPFLGDLPEIIEFDVFYNPVKKIPNFIGKWKQCEKINFTGCQIKEIPNTIGLMQDLKVFDVDYNSISYLPEAIGRCKKLYILGLSHNNLSEFPSSFQNYKTFYILDISYNQFSTLPDCFANIDIRTLKLSGNPLTMLPPFLQKIQKPFTLVIKDTPIRSLSGLPPMLRKKRDYNNPIDTGNLHPDGLKNPLEYYAISPIVLAHRYAANPQSLSSEERTRLQWEGGYEERTILETAIPRISSDDLVLRAITERLQVPTQNGFSLLL
jgi:Leucine-rich repeat (LRR) protein